jgi:hypothetical protein
MCGRRLQLGSRAAAKMKRSEGEHAGGATRVEARLPLPDPEQFVATLLHVCQALLLTNTTVKGSQAHCD